DVVGGYPYYYMEIRVASPERPVSPLRPRIGIRGVGREDAMRRLRSLLTSAGLGASALVIVMTVYAPPSGAVTRGAALANAASYASSHGYHVGISVYDTKTHRLYGSGWHSGTFASESVVKVFIATRLLVSGRMHGTTAARAYKMITQSDDAIATAFYGSVGGDSLITWIKNHYHVPSLGSPPRRAGWWGNTHITPDGLVRLYAKLKADDKVRPWLLNAMHHATKYGSDGTYQFFGLPSATTHAAIKQGWGNDYDDGARSADFNTTGFVNGDRYAVAILARGPISTYGGRIGGMLTRIARLLLPGGAFPDVIPSIEGMQAVSGPLAGGTRVVIQGTGFSHITGVYFGGVRATGLGVLAYGRIAVHTPQHAAGRVAVRVFTTHGNSSATGAYFTYVAAPTVTSTTPTSGPTAGGTLITLHGTNFRQVTRVTVGSVAAPSVKVISSTSLQAVTPAHLAGSVSVQVTTSYGTSPDSAGGTFMYVDPPSVTAVAPTTGPSAGGTTVTVTGTGFAAATGVLFGAVPAPSITVDSPTSITAVVPAQAGGPVDVRVVGPYGTSAVVAADTFTYE
ncbi:MAG TPA: IPT/TIG domain-containing protein, partial [Jatrophihabitans sp.]|nr:IPT/TIG domain-containing protein [Jatrophihabitans sp.]